MEAYQRIKSLGEGSYGRVFLARRKADGKLVCVKAMSLGALSPKERESCRNEAKLMRSMAHPNICTFFESFVANRGATLCIAMAFCDGGDLANTIERGPIRGGPRFTERRVLLWFAQLALGLQYLHSQRVLHRDIKAQNAFVLSSGPGTQRER